MGNIEQKSLHSKYVSYSKLVHNCANKGFKKQKSLIFNLENLVDVIVALVTPCRQMVLVATAPTFFIKYETSLKWKVSLWKVPTFHTLSAQKASGKVWNALREFFVQPLQDCHGRW